MICVGIGFLYFMFWLLQETGVYFTLFTLLCMFTIFCVSIYSLQELEKSRKEKQEKLNREQLFWRELKYNREHLFSNIKKMIVWREEANRDFEDTLDLINGYTEEEIQSRHRI